MVGKGDVAASAGTVDNAAPTLPASDAGLRAAISRDSRRRRHDRRVDLVA